MKCCYSVVQHNMILHMVWQWLKQNMHLRIYTQKTAHISPLWASYGLSFVRIGVKIGRLITAPHCTLEDTCRMNILDWHDFLLCMNFYKKMPWWARRIQIPLIIRIGCRLILRLMISDVGRKIWHDNETVDNGLHAGHVGSVLRRFNWACSTING